MLKKNINVEGLCNGALGVVKGINFDKTRTYVESLSIKWDNLDEVYVLRRNTAEYEYQKNIYIHRSQFPITLAWAMTIHKVQGVTLDRAIISIGAEIFEPGMAYVALSRVKKLENVHLIDFDETVLACDEVCVNEYNRLHLKYGKGSLITNYKKWHKLNGQNLYPIKKALVTSTEIQTHIKELNKGMFLLMLYMTLVTPNHIGPVRLSLKFN